MNKLKEIFNGVYEYLSDDKSTSFLLTKNLVPSTKVYDEKLLKIDNIEYRTWNPYKSKLAAAIKCNLKTFAFKNDSKVLYLGAATGTTVSHISDICINGQIYCIEFSSYAMQSLINVCEKRHNLIPILADARKVEDYSDIGRVDIIYQDVAQPDQVRILKLNAAKFLSNQGIAYLCLKARSVDVSKSNEEIYKQAETDLKESFEIIEKINISKFESDHMFYVLKFK
ncbi:MAG: fibrillarin-like rRNA/tRNA 2'-O-methyltransferase [Candidatus Anstonellales archaeon]